MVVNRRTSYLPNRSITCLTNSCRSASWKLLSNDLSFWQRLVMRASKETSESKELKLRLHPAIV